MVVPGSPRRPSWSGVTLVNPGEMAGTALVLPQRRHGKWWWAPTTVHLQVYGMGSSGISYLPPIFLSSGRTASP